MLLSRIGKNRKQKDAHRRICSAKDAALILNAGQSDREADIFHQRLKRFLKQAKSPKPTILQSIRQARYSAAVPSDKKTHIYYIDFATFATGDFNKPRVKYKNRNSSSCGKAFRPVFGFQTLGVALMRRRFGSRGFDLCPCCCHVGTQTACVLSFLFGCKPPHCMAISGEFGDPSVRLPFAAVFAAHDVDDPAIALYQDKADHAFDKLQRTAYDIERQNRKRRKPA